VALALRLSRRRLLQLGLATSLPVPAVRALAQEPFPNRPIVLWVPWAAGGATDQTLRQLAEGASQRLGQRVIVENRGGAGGTLVMPTLTRAAADGYTLAQLPQTALRAPYLQKVSWDPIRDTTPILQLSGVTFGMLSHPGSGVKTLDDMFAYARSHPSALTVATNGVGTTPHLVMDELMARKGLTYVHVPYKGSGEQLLAVASGQVVIGIGSTGFAPFVDNGSLRLLCTMSEQRSARWPTVPTLRELGHGIVAMSPYGLVAPRGLPPPVLQVLHDAFKAALHDPSHIAELAKYDQTVSYLGPSDYGRSLREAYVQEGRNVERLGLARGG
jgi:tripartite-type tricarboxylate transporter receptor subunit TctC